MQSVDVVTFASELESDNAPFLLDVRNPDEAAFCSIKGSVLIPLSELQQRFAEVPKDRAIVVQCHHGRRSAQAVQFLQSQGYENIRNLTGGIDAWSQQVDPETPRY